jgi:hypothetical protein
MAIMGGKIYRGVEFCTSDFRVKNRGGKLSPKKTISGLVNPPHFSHFGTSSRLMISDLFFPIVIICFCFYFDTKTTLWAMMMMMIRRMRRRRKIVYIWRYDMIYSEE